MNMWRNGSEEWCGDAVLDSWICFAEYQSDCVNKQLQNDKMTAYIAINITWHGLHDHIVCIGTSLAVNAMSLYWWSSISSGCSVDQLCLHLSRYLCHTFVHCVQATNKNATVQGVFWRWPAMIAPAPVVTVDVLRHILYSVTAVFLVTVTL